MGNEFKNNTKRYLSLNEGIRFFKNSKRMYKLAGIIQKVEKNNKISEKISEIARNMEILEKSFSLADRSDKNKIKTKYNNLSIKYSQLIDMINNDEIIGGLKKVGALAAVIAATLTGYYYIATNGDIVMKGFADETESRFGIRPSDEALKSVKAQLEKDGPFDYVKELKTQGKKILASNNSSYKFINDITAETGNTLISAGENMGNVAKITAAASGGGVLGLLGITKIFKMLLGFKKAKRLKFYNKTVEVLNKVEKYI